MPLYVAWTGMGATRLSLPQTLSIKMNTAPVSIPARSSPGSSRTAPSITHRRGGDKYATGATSTTIIHGKDYISIAIWNVRTLAHTGRLQKVTHELDRYTWHVVGLCEIRWKNIGEHPTEKGHILSHSGELDSHTRGVGFLVNNNIKSSVLGCRPVSSRLISIRFRAAPLSITIVQVYAPITDYDDDQVKEFYNQIQETIDKVQKKNILIVQRDWNAKVGTDALTDWKNYCGLPVRQHPMSSDNVWNTWTAG